MRSFIRVCCLIGFIVAFSGLGGKTAVASGEVPAPLTDQRLVVLETFMRPG